MTYPQQPQGPSVWDTQGYYQQPQQQFAPQQPMQPQQGFAPQQPPMQQQFAQPQQQQAQQPALAQGSLDQYFSQPSAGGGAALKFEQGTVHVGIVARAITSADVQQQTQPGTGTPQFYRDGRPKFVMKVPFKIQADQNHPDGLAQWYVAGAARDELMRAMAEAGAPEGPPESGAAIRIECTGTRSAGPGMNPAKVYSVQYQRPQGAAPVQQAPQQPEPQQAPAQPEQPAQQAPLPEPPAVPQQQSEAPQQAPAQQPAANPEFSAEQNQLLAQLTGKG